MNSETKLNFLEMPQRVVANYDTLLTMQGKDEPPYEVTQLITSLVGIFVWIKDVFREENHAVKWPQLKTQLIKRSLPSGITQMSGTESNYLNFFLYLRRGLAQGNFKICEDQPFKKVVVWNYPFATTSKKDWQVKVEVLTLEKVARWTVYDLNAAAFATFGKPDTEVRSGRSAACECQNCGFLWLGGATPQQCPSCGQANMWNLRGVLNMADVEKWDLAHSKY